MAKVRSLFVGIDVGTTAIKAAVYDSDGVAHALASVSSKVVSERPDFSEQSMDGVWDCVRSAIQQVLLDVDSGRIRSIGIAGQGDGLWPLDADIRPVRNAILWNDTRAQSLVRDWIDDGTADQLARYSRTSIWPGTSGAIYRWLELHEPETAAKIEHIVYAKDWISYCLTGNLATDFSDASIPFLDLESRCFAKEAFDLQGAGRLVDAIPTPRSSIEAIGTVRSDLAKEFGLSTDVTVAIGALDLAAMHVALGLNNPSDVLMILGTTAVMNVITEPRPFDATPVGATCVHPFGENWIRIFAPQSGASALDWFASTCPESFSAMSAAEKAKEVSTKADAAPPGANGVAFLPFLTGERAPFVAPHASAAFLGLNSSTTQSDLARAVMEGASFSLRHCFEATGTDTPREVVLTGGGARNPVWCDIAANILGATIVATDASDHGLWGASVLGAAAAGYADARKDFSRQEDRRRHDPDPGTHREYSKHFSRYLAAIDIQRSFWEL